MRLLIEDCAVLDPDVPRGIRSHQNIVVSGNRIESIGNERPAEPFARILPAHSRLAIPGLINAHTHSAENFLRATTDRMGLEPWLVYLFGMCGPYSPRDHYLSIMLGNIEMIRSGVTGVVDHFWMSPAPNGPAMDAAMEAYRDSGMRAAVAPLYRDGQYDIDYGIEDGYPLADTFFAQIGSEFAPLDVVLSMVEDFIRRWDRVEGGRLLAFVGPSGLQWCTEELMVKSLELARKYQTGFHMHLLETRVQDWACRRRFGKPGTQWLAERGLLGPDVSLPHSVHLSPKDVEYLAAHGASVVHNPAANLKLGSGLAPVRTMLDMGVNVALGTDGAASSDNQVLFEALRLAAMIHNAGDHDRWISAHEAWRMATNGGAQVMGLTDQVGKLQEGYLADIVLLDLDSPHLVPLNDPIRHMAFCESGASVRSVVIDGEVVMHDEIIEAFDEKAILEEAAEATADRPVRRPVPENVADAIARFTAFQKDIVQKERTRHA
jgi:cytosine/adenosine deaminase-related metal-dependent hydrolase